jgi:hypothetical protein
MTDLWIVVILCFVLYQALKRLDDNERRRRELDELRDRRAELDIKLQVLVGALERLRSDRFVDDDLDWLKEVK